MISAQFLSWLFIVLLIFIVLTAVFNWVLSLILARLEEAVKYFSTLAKEKEKLADPNYQESEKILGEARRKAEEIVKEAKIQVAEGQKVLEEALKAAAERQAKELEVVTGEWLTTTQERLKKVGDEDINTVQSITKDIEKQVETGVETLKSAILAETVSSQKEMTQKVEAAYQEMVAEVKKEEQERLAKVDRKIYDVLLYVSQKVLGRTMPISEHERLVTESLEKAKAQDFFKET